MRRDPHCASITLGTHLDFQVGGRQIRRFFRPLDETDGFRIEVVAEATVFQFLLIKEPIKIKVIQV